MTVWVELLFPLAEVKDGSLRAVYVDGLSNQGYGQGGGSGVFAPQAPRQIGYEVGASPPTFLYAVFFAGVDPVF